LFSTSKEYVITSPTFDTVAGVAVFTRFTADSFTVTVDGVLVTDFPDVSVPDAVAVLTIDPAAMSAAVGEYDAVHVMDAPAARIVDGQDTTTGAEAAESIGSFTATPESVVVPVLVTRKE